MTAQVLELNTASATCLDALAPDVFDNPIDPDQLRSFLDDPRHIMMIAMEDGIVVGMASAVEYFHPDKQPQLWINEIGVTPAKRRCGIGRRLTEALVACAESRGCSYAWVGTDIQNEAAQATFASVPDVECPQQFLLFEWDFVV